MLRRLEAEGELAATGFSDDDLGSLLTRLELEEKQGREETFDAAAALEAEPEGPTACSRGNSGV